MAKIIRMFVETYHFLNEDAADPRTKDWLFIATPWPIFGIIVTYLYFVFTIGPRLMAKRPPFKLERVMQIYNVVQIVLSGYLFYRALTLAWWNNYSYVCEPVDYSDDPIAIQIARTVWMYFIVKIIDLLDTIFFVLRKKDNQISFLHVYHHAGMIFATWCGVKYLPGGHVTFIGLLNSLVHVVMYSHYLATSFKINRPWWKKYITQMQLLQFFLILIHASLLLFVEDCGFPVWTLAILLPQNLFMVVLFGEFYYNTYVKKSKKNITTNLDNNQINKDK
ncbi:hypothetical protein HCN44_007598 [Aphidius gifuensis]|uniref:Elongation of very long chain fatty acids protein n=1 Tax=Aphidius gifuensis TaxID=684658 RepID=A0A834XMN2_APHGI|nr:hypothetical protein HCN44_007598 [Aphidius gifuensis]